MGVLASGENSVSTDTTPFDAPPAALFADLEEESLDEEPLDEDDRDGYEGHRAHEIPCAVVVLLPRADRTTIVTGRRRTLPVRQRGPPVSHA